MSTDISANTQAILLLTAPLILGRSAGKEPLLSAREYQALAFRLREEGVAPANLLESGNAEARAAAEACVARDRLDKLLSRGFKLAQAIERWHARSIWVLSRADAAYPRRLKARFRADAPALLYGCGDASLLDRGGLAVVGSRKVDDSILEFTAAVARCAAEVGRPIVSGGARGVDQAAMDGAMEAGGWATGVLADGLEKAATRRAFRKPLLEQRLVLASPFDPGAGFNVGHAMQRNKYVYALADASLVVQAEVDKGGTWAGAKEQLSRYRFGPVYVRSTTDAEPAASALRELGALAWPNPLGAEAWKILFDTTTETDAPQSDAFAEPCEPPGEPAAAREVREVVPTERPERRADEVAVNHEAAAPVSQVNESVPTSGTAEAKPPAQELIDAVRVVLANYLSTPATEKEVAEALDVQPGQAKRWLEHLVEEGVLEKRTRPVRYVIRERPLFD